MTSFLHHQFFVDIFLYWDAGPLTMKTIFRNSLLEKDYLKNVKLSPISLLPIRAKFSEVYTWSIFLMMFQCVFKHCPVCLSSTPLLWDCSCQSLKKFCVGKFSGPFSILLLLHIQQHPHKWPLIPWNFILYFWEITLCFFYRISLQSTVTTSLHSPDFKKLEFPRLNSGDFCFSKLFLDNLISFHSVK